MEEMILETTSGKDTMGSAVSNAGTDDKDPVKQDTFGAGI